jgi:hypothetical protein
MGTLSSILATGFNALQRQSNNHFTTLRDYQHASKIFRPNNSSFLPKSKNWFHIFFEMDPAAVTAVTAALGSAVSNLSINWLPSNLPILGILARTAKLPDFKFKVETKNQYNRPSLITTKINYDPIELTFWDDTVDAIRGFWYAYYQYMIQDPRYVNFQATQLQGISIPNQWSPSTSDVETLYSTSTNWGVNYGLDTVNALGSPLNRTNPFFRSIRIYQFNRTTDPNVGPQYSEYVLVNPVITSFAHDTVDLANSEFMQNKMSIEYETVLYNAGIVNDNEIASWDAVLQRFFDTEPSPLTDTTPGGNNQLGSVLANSFELANQLVQKGVNTGQATTATVLTQTVVDGYGTSGQPPEVLGA